LAGYIQSEERRKETWKKPKKYKEGKKRERDKRTRKRGEIDGKNPTPMRGGRVSNQEGLGVFLVQVGEF